MADSVRPCHQGIHACRTDQLAYWLHDELWEIDLADDIVVDVHKVVARRGRIVRRVDQWREAWRELAEVSAWRTRDLGVDTLARHDLAEIADRLRTPRDLAQLAGFADEADQLGGQTFVGRVIAYAADAGHFATHGEPAQAPFVAAVAAGYAATGGGGSEDSFEDAFAEERHYQSAWIVEKLRLS